MAEYVAGKGTTALGIIGTTLGALGASGVNLLGGNGAYGNMGYGYGGYGYPGYSWGGHVVNHYELNQEKELAQKEAEIAYWRGQDETNGKLSHVYSNLERQIQRLDEKVQAHRDEQNGINMQQAVYNGTNTATISCIQGQIAAQHDLLRAITRVGIPNNRVWPGWGDVTVAPAAADAAAAGA